MKAVGADMHCYYASDAGIKEVRGKMPEVDWIDSVLVVARSQAAAARAVRAYDAGLVSAVDLMLRSGEVIKALPWEPL